MGNDWRAADRILCVRLDTLGDVLMTGPAMRALAGLPGSPGLTLLTSPSGAAAAELLPELRETITYEAPWLKTEPRADESLELEMIERLRGGRFDAAVIFTTYTQSALPAALMCHLAGIPLRLAHSRENPYWLLSDHAGEPDDQAGASVRHEVRRQLDLVASVGATTEDERMRVAIPETARERIRTLMAEIGLGGGESWAVVHPGASAPSRRYPPELWAEACVRLARDHGFELVFTGDAGEAELAARLAEASGPGARSLAGHLSVAELAALLELAPLLVSGNTGPVHVAAAVGTAVVDLYALTNPQHTPWGVRSRVLSHDVPCRWCRKSICPEGHHLCLRGVAPAEVVEAALALSSGAREAAARGG